MFGKLNPVNPDARRTGRFSAFSGRILSEAVSTLLKVVAKDKVAGSNKVLEVPEIIDTLREGPGSRHTCPLIHHIQLSWSSRQYPNRPVEQNAATCSVFRTPLSAFTSSSDIFCFENAQHFFCHVIGFELSRFEFE